jgi:hypothetical protein
MIAMWFLLLLLNPISIRCITNATSKAGLAWPNGNSVNISQFVSPKVSWYYDWNPIRPDLSKFFGSSPVPFEFIPMLWGTNQIQIFNENVWSLAGQGAISAILGFNE